jgi:conjugal transfer pilus assembly protein TraD
VRDRDYENPWRPNHEALAVALWLGLGAVAWTTAEAWALHPLPFRQFALAALLLALTWLPGTWRVWRRRARLRGRPQAFLDPATLRRRLKRHPDALWLGWGFPWDVEQAQLTHDLLRIGPSEMTGTVAEDTLGAHWLHGLADRETPVWLPLAHAEGHVLVAGTTGAGKTRLFDLLVTQAVLRGEAVVIIDPKGDRDLKRAAERACALAGRPERFVHFHPAFPRESARIDPLHSFNRPTELASRVAALIPGETGNDPFKAFGQMAMSTIVQGLLATGERPSLLTLRRYLEGGAEALVARVIERHVAQHVPEWEAASRRYLQPARDLAGRAAGWVRYYREAVREHHPCTVVDGLASLFEHEQVHFAKMIASLMPILNMLTAADLGPLLSPDAADPRDRRRLTSMAECIERAQVVYLGLDALSDAMVGSAIGSILVADLAAVAGDRYNYGVGLSPVNVFIDEAAEVVNDPFIQLLNKGRGAGLRLVVATQTFADFAARTGSQAKARQVLGNLNTLIALRILDAETQQYVTDSLPKVRLRGITRAQGSAASAVNPLRYSGNVREQLAEEAGELFPPALLGQLPNLHYLARLAGGRVVKGRLPILAGAESRGAGRDRAP